MNARKKIPVALALTLFIGSGSVEGQILYDALSSRTFYSLPTDKTGNPLWLNAWGRGTILGANGVNYKAEKMNYDVLSDKVIFEMDGITYVFQDRVTEFNIESKPGETWKRFVRSASQHPLLPSPFVEVLESGRIGFFKHVGKVVVEITEYNSMPKKVIEDRIQYFVLANGVLQKVLLNKKTLIDLFSDHKDQIETLLNKQSVSPKTEAGWMQVIHYLNNE